MANILNSVIDLIKNNQLKPEHIKNYIKKNDPIKFDEINSIDINETFSYKFLFYYFEIENKICKCCGKEIVRYSQKPFRFILENKNIFDYCNKCYYEASGRKRNLYEKRKETYQERYGFDHPLKNKDIQQKIKDTCIKRYGENYIDVFCDKMTRTMIYKYGVKTNLQLDGNKQKSKETLLMHYGVDNYAKSDKFKEIYIIQKYNRLLNDPLVEPLFSLDDFKNKEELSWKCKKCGNIFQSKYDYNWPNRARCLKCFPLLCGESNSEKEICKFLIDNNINIETKKRNIIPPFEIDIYLPDYNIAIEYDGLYWHSDECIDDKYYHLNKTNLCKEKGIQLIHIFEDEWIYKKDIVKSRLLSIIGLYSNTIYARKCLIKEIDNNQYMEFENNTHLQGYSQASIRLGLFYDNELISVMSFSKYRIALGSKPKENEYELIRFSNKLNTKVIGGASKLFHYFIKKYKPVKIISYCDKRWSEGKLYTKLNFNKVKDTDPNYWYVNCHTNQRNYRFKYRKSQQSKLLQKYNENLSEYDNMRINGFSRIWDCGNILFEWVL